MLRPPRSPASQATDVYLVTDIRVCYSGGTLHSTHPALSDSYLSQFQTEGARLNLVARLDERLPRTVGPLDTSLRLVPVRSERGRTKPQRLLSALVIVSRMKFSAEDVVIVRVPETLGLALGSVAALQGAQLVANVVAFPDAIGSGTPLLGAATNPLVRKLSQTIVNRAAAVVYVTRKALQNALPPPAAVPTFTKSNIVFPDHYFADQAKDTFGRGELQLITVGSLNGNIKGVDTVLRALSILVRKKVNFQFTVVGDGTSRTELEELARDLGLAGRVRFLGQIDSKSDLVRYLKQADLFVLASRTEGLPRAMIEASAVGLPAIGSRVGGIPELVPRRALFDSGDYDGLASLLESLHSNRSLLTTLANEQHHNAVDLIRTARTPIFRQVIYSIRAQRRPSPRPSDRK